MSTPPCGGKAYHFPDLKTLKPLLCMSNPQTAIRILLDKRKPSVSWRYEVHQFIGFAVSIYCLICFNFRITVIPDWNCGT